MYNAFFRFSAPRRKESSRQTEIVQHSPFLALPQELRNQIYDLIILNHCPWYYNKCMRNSLLSVCRQIRAETLDMVLRIARRFGGLKQLAHWVDRGTLDNLRGVENLSLYSKIDGWDRWRRPNLADYALAVPSRVRSVVQRARHGSVLTKSQMQRNEASLVSIRKSLSRLPNVAHVELLASREGTLARTDDAILALIAHLWPKLRWLEMSCSYVSLDSLSRMRDLTLLEMSGYAFSTPKETLTILRHLTKLISFKVNQFRDPVMEDVALGSRKQAGMQRESVWCVTPEVVAGMHALESISISYSATDANEKIDVAMLDALMPHKETLRYLSLSSDNSTSHEVMARLRSFIEGSKLTSFWLRINWPPNDIGDDYFDDCWPPHMEFHHVSLYPIGSQW